MQAFEITTIELNNFENYIAQFFWTHSMMSQGDEGSESANWNIHGYIMYFIWLALMFHIKENAGPVRILTFIKTQCWRLVYSLGTMVSSTTPEVTTSIKWKILDCGVRKNLLLLFTQLHSTALFMFNTVNLYSLNQQLICNYFDILTLQRGWSLYLSITRII